MPPAPSAPEPPYVERALGLPTLLARKFHFLLGPRQTGSRFLRGEPLAYWRSTSGFEVDFILGDHTAIEVKASQTIDARDLKPLLALAEEGKLRRYICVSFERQRRQLGIVTVLPWNEFLSNLWAGEYRDLSGTRFTTDRSSPSTHR